MKENFQVPSSPLYVRNLCLFGVLLAKPVKPVNLHRAESPCEGLRLWGSVLLGFRSGVMELMTDDFYKLI